MKTVPWPSGICLDCEGWDSAVGCCVAELRHLDQREPIRHLLGPRGTACGVVVSQASEGEVSDLVIWRRTGEELARLWWDGALRCAPESAPEAHRWCTDGISVGRGVERRYIPPTDPEILDTIEAYVRSRYHRIRVTRETR